MEKSPQELKVEGDWLLVFIDDTGHEAYKGSQDYYGLGGCAVLGAGYDHLKKKWREVRQLVNGSPDAPLHAADMDRTPTNFEALSTFFLDPSFVRIAVTSTRKASYPNGMHPAVPVMGTLQEHIDKVASLIPCNRVVIIVESSQRADPVLMQHFGQLTSQAVQRTKPVEHWLMPKSSAEPGLEVADFIISAAGSETRRLAKGVIGHAPDFADVFTRLAPVGCLFSFIRDTDGEKENGDAMIQGFAYRRLYRETAQLMAQIRMPNSDSKSELR